MGKLPYMYTDSEDMDTSSSVENVKKKKKFSILKHSNGNVKKKKCKVHSHSEPDDLEFRNRSSQRVKYKLRGILKHDRERESSDDEDEPESIAPRSQDRCLVGRVPRPTGTRPGRGGGLAIVVRKDTVMNIDKSGTRGRGGRSRGPAEALHSNTVDRFSSTYIEGRCNVFSRPS